MIKSNSTFNISILFLGILFIFLNFNSSTGAISKYNGNPKSTLLEKYGEQVFENEKCSRCHVLNIEDENRWKKSLDGYGGLKSSTFIATLLNEPGDVNPGTKMPSFKDLLNSNLDKEVLREVLEKESNSVTDFETSWNKLNQQASLIKKEIDEEGALKHTISEATALIAFLQSIPKSKALKESLNIQRKEFEKEDKIQQKFIEKSDKIVQDLAVDEKNIALGKELYENRCAMCHGEKGEGMIGPNLTDEYWIYGSSAKNISDVIVNGTPKGMPASKNILTPTEIGQVVTYLMEIKGTNVSGGKAPEGEKE